MEADSRPPASAPCQVAPNETLRDSSGSSGLAPSSRASVAVTGAVRTRTYSGTPPTTRVRLEVEE